MGLEEVELALLGYIHWFNTRRIHHQIGGIPPAEFEATYYNELGQLQLRTESIDRAFEKPGEVHRLCSY